VVDVVPTGRICGCFDASASTVRVLILQFADGLVFAFFAGLRKIDVFRAVFGF
jgi:hypothetical protein